MSVFDEFDDRMRFVGDAVIGFDLLFLFDTSSSIASSDFNKVVSFAEVLLNELRATYKTGTTHVAAISFGDEAQLEFNLNDTDTVGNMTAVNRRLREIQPSGGGVIGPPPPPTNTAAALNLAAEQVLGELRPQAAPFLFLFKDGNLNITGSAEETAWSFPATVREQFEIYAIGIGDHLNIGQLNATVSEPQQEHLILLSNYEMLDTLADVFLENSESYAHCGISGDINETVRVEQPHVAGKGAWPWLTLVKVITSEDDTEADVLCAGSLLCPGWVLTSARCLESTNQGGTIVPFVAENLTVTAGEYNRTVKEGFEQTTLVREITRHPGYQYGGPSNDIALLKLEPEFIINRYVRTVCVPQSDGSVTGTSIADTPGWFVGWGSVDPGQESLSDLPKQVQFPIADQDSCMHSTLGAVTQDSFCAGHLNRPQDTCEGDAGSPLVVRSNNDRFVVRGVAHQHPRCAESNQYGVFTDILDFYPWINEVTGGCNQT